VTRKEHAQDRLEQTIVLLMVPPENPAPWLAGGGSTLRGVADDGEDDKPLEPFTCITYRADPEKGKSKLDGKRGTLAIMGDGKVRFIPSDVSVKDFRAMCTIAGNDKIAKLDDVAPVIEDDSERDMKGGGVGLPIDQGEKPAPPKEQPKEVSSNNKGKIEGTKWISAEDVELKGVKFPKGTIGLEFRRDGALVQTAVISGTALEIPGKWSLGKGDDVLTEMDVPNEGVKKETLKIVITGDQLSGTDPEGKTITFTRDKGTKPKDRESNNKGKLDGTKWTSDAVQVNGGQVPAGAISLEFKKDGTFTQVQTVPNRGPVTSSGGWSLGGGDDVTLEISKVKTTVQITVKDDKMTLTQLGVAMPFSKAK